MRLKLTKDDNALTLMKGSSGTTVSTHALHVILLLGNRCHNPAACAHTQSLAE